MPTKIRKLAKEAKELVKAEATPAAPPITLVAMIMGRRPHLSEAQPSTGEARKAPTKKRDWAKEGFQSSSHTQLSLGKERRTH